MSEYLNAQDLHALILRPDAHLVKRGEQHPKVGGGIYALFDGDDGLLYIGQSLHIFNRITQHWWAYRRRERSRFEYWSALDVPVELMKAVECAHIWALEPPENSMPRPDSTLHDRLVEEVKKAWGVE